MYYLEIALKNLNSTHCWLYIVNATQAYHSLWLRCGTGTQTLIQEL